MSLFSFGNWPFVVVIQIKNGNPILLYDGDVVFRYMKKKKWQLYIHVILSVFYEKQGMLPRDMNILRQIY